jgi:hypothetical protein
MPNATVRANAPASPKSANPASPTPEAEPAKHPRVIAAEIVAGVELEKKIKQIQFETEVQDAEKEAENDRHAACARFSHAHHAWLKAKLAIQEPSDEDIPAERLKVEAEAERRFFTTPAVFADHVWDKLEAFEEILAHELRAGERTDSILLLALGAIKQDILNLNLFWGDK